MKVLFEDEYIPEPDDDWAMEDFLRDRFTFDDEPEMEDLYDEDESLSELEEREYWANVLNLEKRW